MYVNKISIGRGKKLSINYNSYDYHVSVSVKVDVLDDTLTAHKLALSTIKILEQEEVKKLKEEIK